MTKEIFRQQLQLLLHKCNPATACGWIAFAENCVSRGQFVDFEPMPNEAESTEKWLDVIFSGLRFVKAEYGDGIANQVCTLSTTQRSLYPGEMDAAAKHFLSGGSAEEIDGLVESGALKGDSRFVPRARGMDASEKSYVIAICTDSDFYIPNAEHIERNDSLIPWAVPDDSTAAHAAMQDGVCLIRGMDGVPDDVYVDTPENRHTISDVLGQRLRQDETIRNQTRIYADMPDCVRLLSALENELGGKSGSFGEWLRTVYELNDDFDEAPADATQRLCTAFKEVKKSYGTAIASTLYNAQTIVLASELMPAAMYLQCGGDMEAAKALAVCGFFMEDYDCDSMKQAAQFIADGGAANEVYSVITQNEKEDSLQAEASTLTMAQSL